MNMKSFTNVTNGQSDTGSARPEVRGTAEPHGGAYPPCSTPPSYVLTSIILTTLRTDKQRPIVFDGRVCAPFCVQFEAEGVL